MWHGDDPFTSKFNLNYGKLKGSREPFCDQTCILNLLNVLHLFGYEDKLNKNV
jgi:hypothetical protein